MNRRLSYRLGAATVFSAMTLSFAYAADVNVPPPGITGGPVLGASVVAPPPAGFNPLIASAAELAKYAIPPAPDAKGAPAAFAQWKRAVAGGHSNGPTPVLTATNISNGPVQKAGSFVKQGTSNNILTGTSNNWSGPADYNSARPFRVEAIIGEFVVPAAHQAFGHCTGGWDYSSQWPGIDGYGSGDVLQAGTEVDAYCNGSATSSFYSAWVEWYPFNETRISSPAIHAGDLMYVEVWNTTSTNGYAYVDDVSTQTAVTYHLTPPSGTSLVGNSVEWIVERPGVGGGLATLTNYIDVSWPYGVAWNWGAASANRVYYWEGANPPTGTQYRLTMLDNSHNGISAATVENADFLYFTDFGSAY